MQPIFIAVVIVIVGAGIEYFTRSAPAFVRWGLLALVALLALYWLATLLGLA